MADAQSHKGYRNGDMSMKEEISEDNAYNNRSRSRSPVRKSRSRSRSPRDWKRNERDSRRGSRDQSMGINSKRVFVSNIHYDTRWMTLKDLFKTEVGDVAYVELYETPDGKPTGSGIVEFKDKDTAQKAIEVMHRYDFRGRKLVVREERESDRRRIQRMREDSMSKGGMGDNDMGRGMMGRDPGRGMMDSGMMSGGMGNMGGGMGNMGGGMGGGMPAAQTPNIPGINPQLLQQLGIEGPVTTQVFVANLDYKVTERKLTDIFKMAGKVESAELKLDKDGKSRGMGTVRFQHPMEAVQAISMFNGQILYDRAMSVRMDKMAEPAGSSPLPSKLPSGLKSIGMGLGANGMPIQNVAQLGDCSPLNIAGNTQMSAAAGMMGGGMNTGLGGMGAGMGQPAMNAGMGGMSGMGGGMGNPMGQNNMGGMNSGMAGMGQMGGGQMGNMGTGMGMGGNMGAMGSNMGGGMNNMGMNSMGGGGMGLGSGMDTMGGQRGDGLLGGMGGSAMGGMMGAGMMNNAMGNNMQRVSTAGGMDECCSVYVKNIPFNYTWQNLKERFRHIGEVRYAAIKTEHGKSKGCGVVRFASMEHARMALSMNGARIDGRPIEVTLLNRGDRI